MHFIKITAIVLILFAGIAGSYIIVKNSLPKMELAEKKENIGKSIDSIVKNPIQWIKNAISSDAVNNTYGGNSSLNKEFADKNLNSPNFTEFAAKSFFNQMKILDQQGKNPFDDFNPDDPEGRKFIENSIASIQNPSQIFNILINDNDLKISDDNSKEAVIQYLKEIEQINNNQLGNIKNLDADQMIRDLQNDCFANNPSSSNRKLAALYKNLADDYLNLMAPRDLLAFHTASINHFKKSNLIYSALADCFSDPIKSGLVIDELQGLLEKEKEIQNMLNQIWEEINNL